MKYFLLILLLIAGVCLSFLSKPQPKRILFNGKNLEGWDTYLGPAFDTVKNKFAGEAAGLNADPENIFSVVQEDGKSALRISGKCFGGISTKDDFQNYHLRLEFKWGKQKWQPKKNNVRDSGLLYHAVGPHAADGNFWMRSQELQIQEGDCGDYWGVAGGMADVPALKKNNEVFVYDPTAPLRTFSASSETGRRCFKNPDAEKPSGEWNVVDLYCVGDTSVHVINQVVNMILYNLRQEDKGNFTPLNKGKIQIQSEGAEIFYRNISIENIRQIPRYIVRSN